MWPGPTGVWAGLHRLLWSCGLGGSGQEPQDNSDQSLHLEGTRWQLPAPRRPRPPHGRAPPATLHSFKKRRRPCPGGLFGATELSE